MRRRAGLADAADVVLGGPQDVLRLLAETATQVRRGELDSRIANCLCCIASTALRAVEGIDMARLREEMREEMRRQAQALRRERAEEDAELREVLDDV